MGQGLPFYGAMTAGSNIQEAPWVPIPEPYRQMFEIETPQHQEHPAATAFSGTYYTTEGFQDEPVGGVRHNARVSRGTPTAAPESEDVERDEGDFAEIGAWTATATSTVD